MNNTKKALNNAMKKQGIDFATRIKVLEEFEKEYTQEVVNAYMLDLGKTLFITPQNKLEEKIFKQGTTDPYVYRKYATGIDVGKLQQNLMPITNA